MGGLHARYINIGLGVQQVTFSFNWAAFIVIERAQSNKKSMYLCDLNNGISNFFNDDEIEISCSEKTVTLSCNSSIFRQGLILAI